LVSPIKIDLYDTAVPYIIEGTNNPELFYYPCDNAHSCMVICPGGAYEGLAEHEGHDVALAFNDANISAFVVKYRVSCGGNKSPLHPAPLSDALTAINIAINYGFDKVGIIGFSAGGHLAISCAEHFDYFINLERPCSKPFDCISCLENSCSEHFDFISCLKDLKYCRPDALIACYPVVTMTDYTHLWSRHNLLGDSATEEKIKKFSGEYSVRDDMPPTFIWHTYDDDCVSVKNSLCFATALQEKNIPLEMHIYPHGAHGLGLAREDKIISSWFGHAIQFLHSLGF